MIALMCDCVSVLSVENSEFHRISRRNRHCKNSPSAGESSPEEGVWCKVYNFEFLGMEVNYLILFGGVLIILPNMRNGPCRGQRYDEDTVGSYGR